MERLLDQYLAAVPLREFQWENVSPCIPTHTDLAVYLQVKVLTEEVQQKLLDEVLELDLS